MAQIVGISDCKVSRDRGEALLTHALGSCVAVSMHDSAAQVGGLLHFMLPASALDPAKAALNPCMFADTGIPELLRRVCALGASPRRLRICIVGGARVAHGAGFFEIGRRNAVAARQTLLRLGLAVAADSTGGDVSRHVRLEVDTGHLAVQETPPVKPAPGK